MDRHSSGRTVADGDRRRSSRSGEASTDTLAETLGTSPSAVRQHCLSSNPESSSLRVEKKGGRADRSTSNAALNRASPCSPVLRRLTSRSSCLDRVARSPRRRRPRTRLSRLRVGPTSTRRAMSRQVSGQVSEREGGWSCCNVERREVHGRRRECSSKELPTHAA